MTVFMQIGTNTGNDRFLQLCKQYNPDLIILVEANKIHTKSINNNYKMFPNVKLFTNAIYYENDKEVSLYIPAKDGHYGNPSVQPDRKEGNHTYSHGEFSLLPMNDWGEKKNMCMFKTRTKTFDSVCDSLNVKNIEYLQIDTEGFDSEIIRMIDLDKYNINTIRYEKWNFPEEAFTKHNTNSNNYTDISLLGKNGMQLVEEKLKKYNYIIEPIVDRDGDDMIAIKQK